MSNKAIKPNHALTHRVYHIAPDGITGHDTIYMTGRMTEADATRKAAQMKSDHPGLSVLAGPYRQEYTVDDIVSAHIVPESPWITLLKRIGALIRNLVPRGA